MSPARNPICLLAPSVDLALRIAEQAGLTRAEVQVFSHPEQLRGTSDLTLFQLADLQREVDHMARTGRVRIVQGIEPALFPEERQFRVATDRSGRGGFVPWSFGLEAYERYAKRHGRLQSADRIHARGGFSYGELLAFGFDRREVELALGRPVPEE